MRMEKGKGRKRLEEKRSVRKPRQSKEGW